VPLERSTVHATGRPSCGKGVGMTLSTTTWRFSPPLPASAADCAGRRGRTPSIYGQRSDVRPPARGVRFPRRLCQPAAVGAFWPTILHFMYLLRHGRGEHHCTSWPGRGARPAGRRGRGSVLRLSLPGRPPVSAPPALEDWPPGWPRHAAHERRVRHPALSRGTLLTPRSSRNSWPGGWRLRGGGLPPLVPSRTALVRASGNLARALLASKPRRWRTVLARPEPARRLSGPFPSSAADQRLDSPATPAG